MHDLEHVPIDEQRLSEVQRDFEQTRVTAQEVDAERVEVGVVDYSDITDAAKGQALRFDVRQTSIPEYYAKPRFFRPLRIACAARFQPSHVKSDGQDARLVVPTADGDKDHRNALVVVHVYEA
jgi:hypothetical protein